ncbi:DUF3397 family protein [Levilactobacillus tangyuanensis]|uniref:DUF3397 family protein n=1 Tax=Levilactobacillus tangyuanensis TaxID=2486021 RepID=A0ABW1TL73_9LACO|nr:DUF3397 family protein [Levilactobacillus tangyuanensis]
MDFWTSPGGQLAILAIGWVVIRLVKQVLRRHWPHNLLTWDLMTPLLIICSVILIGDGAGRILPWLVMGWMIIGVIVTLVQAIHNHELLYSTFIRTFWRLTDLYWTVGFVGCLIVSIS